jgi:hypothetical protein
VKSPLSFLCICIAALLPVSNPAVSQEETDAKASILLLHHSTGGVIWNGGVSDWFGAYNAERGSDYRIAERAFPKSSPYGWQNYPYDYWNIWVDHAGDQPYQEEPTLEILTPEYDVIIWKHCYPVSNISPDTGSPDVRSSAKRLENYTLQYEALKAKMREFPETKFIVWTGAALVESATNEENALRAKTFFSWVCEEWDEPGDNIFVWDLYALETGGELYLKPEFAASSGDSHPGADFARSTAPLFSQRIVDVIEGRGDSGNITGNATANRDRTWGQIKSAPSGNTL